MQFTRVSQLTESDWLDIKVFTNNMAHATYSTDFSLLFTFRSIQLQSKTMNVAKKA